MVARADQIHTEAELEAVQQELREAASKMQFPELLDEVNKRLATPLHYERELSSVQQARNCLEHRDGIVQERDVDPVARVLHLRLPGMRLFYEENGHQIEVGPGTQVEKDIELMSQVVVAEREFKLGERVTFRANEFHDIGFGCWVIASDLVDRLPQLSILLLPLFGGMAASAAHSSFNAK